VLLASSTETIHADSLLKTVPLLYFHLSITNIIQTPPLTDAIIDDSYSNVHLTSSIDTIHADSSLKSAPRL
jgi:hypothetical protein